MKRVKGHSHLYRDEQSGAIINTNDKEYNQRLRTLSHSDSQKDELKKMREDIDELKYLLKKLVNVKQT
tara:strand:+ start:11317 stop:11520 length:204 start_codon:yes stop_codon:yes gene_type:complete